MDIYKQSDTNTDMLQVYIAFTICVVSSSLVEESLKFSLLNQGGDFFYPTNVSPLDEEPGYCDHLLQELPQLIPIFQMQRYISLL